MIPAGFPRFFLALMGQFFFTNIQHLPLLTGISCGLIGTMGLVMAVFNFMGGKHRGVLKFLLFSLLGLTLILNLFAGVFILWFAPIMLTWGFLQVYGEKEIPTGIYRWYHSERFEDPRKTYRGQIWLQGPDNPPQELQLVAVDDAEAARIVEEQYGTGYRYTVDPIAGNAGPER